MSVMCKKSVVTAVLAAMFISQEAWCKSGLATRFGDVFVENLDIGQSYNTRELANLPLKVTNTGDDTVELLMDLSLPKKEAMKEHLIKDGYEPIPDLSWIRLSKDRFLLAPGESAFADVIVSIPDDPKLYGKKFQVDIWSHGAPKSFLNLGIYSHLMFTILPSPETRKEQEELQRKGLPANLNFDLIPDKVYLFGIECGKKVNLKKMGKTIKIINSNDFPLTFRIKPVPLADSPVTLQQGYEEAKDLSWIKLGKDKLKIAANSIQELDISVEIPPEEAYRNKNYMFALHVEPDTDKVVLVSYYGKVYVSTK